MRKYFMKTKRVTGECHISVEIDLEYAESKKLEEMNQLDMSLNCSGYVRNTVLQLMLVYNLIPRIHKICDCINEIKSAYAEIFVTCNISMQASLIAFQTICSTFYSH